MNGEMSHMLLKCDGRFNIKGRGLVFTASRWDNPDTNWNEMIGKEIEIQSVQNPSSPLETEGKRYRVKGIDSFRGMGDQLGSNVGILVDEII